MRLSLSAREKYKFPEDFFNTQEGYVTFPEIYLVRLFVESINEKKDLLNFPEQAARASEINGIGLINEISHEIITQYKEKLDPEVYETLFMELSQDLNTDDLDFLMKTFVEEFPPPDVYLGEIEVESYIEGSTQGRPNKEIILEELIHIWLNNNNPSFSKHLELFDDENLEKSTTYHEIITKFDDFFINHEVTGPENLPLLQLLQKPVTEFPYSIKDQLEYITKEWGSFLDPSMYYRLLYALDIFAEEEKIRGPGPGEAQAIDYGEGLEERYTPDKDWMPTVMMIAKTTYVWLDQLSKKYQREIRHLDQIPDEELDQIASWGFNALWLIGLWERSPASKSVKHWCGNPEAEASAYSLYDYVIADDLGGERAFKKLKERTQNRGIRLASDMVPNHTGIDSKWVREHPEWYISLDHPPFPSYTYSGESLSSDPNIGIYLEDHYFSRTDAAVTFKRVDFRTNATKYIYHGNDGTSMPWNDTAQLNYLLSEVREAVIQTILHVARQFPIIRFDAAMTLTKKHFQRLWFPPPGSGGDIPSRAGMGITNEEFHKAIPQEFWREVVDRINQEMPDTLLLAEAFWLLEGFFVRTLGMHRVYNSAFMNMIRDEDNAKYRSVIKNTLEFDPQILKRFVNFMNNPDEETAAKQFGKGEKYFGICMLLVTLPGLPMFGHGQMEGFEEKYGMEYRRAYWEEEIDGGLLQHHERVIVPLIKKRYLFSDVTNFCLFDLYTTEGYVDENVFCYSNGSETERALIIYNNSLNGTAGWIKTSSAKLDKRTNQLQQHSLGDSLLLSNFEERFWIFKDQFSGLEYIRRSSDVLENGFHVILSGYQSMALVEFREVTDNKWKHLSHLNRFLAGRGVPKIEEAKVELIYEHLLKAFRLIYNSEILSVLNEAIIALSDKHLEEVFTKTFEEFQEYFIQVLNYASTYLSESEKKLISKSNCERVFGYLMRLRVLNKQESLSRTQLKRISSLSLEDLAIVYAWIILKDLGKNRKKEDSSIRSRSLLDEWHLGHTLRDQLDSKSTLTTKESNSILSLVKILVRHQNWYKDMDFDNPAFILRKILSNPEVSTYININRFQDVLWFNCEDFEELIDYLGIIALMDSVQIEDIPTKETEKTIELISSWKDASAKSSSKLENLFNSL